MTKAKLLVQICPYCLKCIKFGKLFLRKVRKLLPPDALILAQNAPKCVWRPGSARTRWGSLSAPQDPLAAKRGPTSKGEGKGEGRGGKRRGGKGGRKGREGAGRWQSPPPTTSYHLKHWACTVSLLSMWHVAWHKCIVTVHAAAHGPPQCAWCEGTIYNCSYSRTKLHLQHCLYNVLSMQ